MVKLHHAAMSVAAISIAGAGAFAALPVAAASASTSTAAGSHHAAPAHPAKPMNSINRNCGDGDTGGNEWDCIEIGQNPWYIHVTDTIVHHTRTVQICLHKDGESDECTPFEVIQPGQTESASYGYQGPGRYCAVIWRLNPNGTHTVVDQGQCVTMG